MGCIFYYTLTDGLHPFGKKAYDLEANIMQRKHHLDILSIKSNHVGCIHLILSMIQHHSTDRPSCSAILSHHFFWSSQKIIHFITDICSIGETDSENCLHFNDEPNQLTFCQQEWMMKLDSEVEDFIKSSIPLYTEIGCSVLSLLKIIHYMHKNLPPKISCITGNSISDFCMYWFGVERYPYLITLAWIKCLRMGDNRIREKYYALATQFSRIIDSIAVLTPTKCILKTKVGRIRFY